MADKYGEPPFTQGARFGDLEREFKQRVPIIVSNDYAPTGGGRPFQGFPIHEPLRTLCSLHFGGRRIGEFDAAMV
jgi:hypothetical protein